MADELIYTSASRGLRPGTRGFCTVAYTQGMRPESIRVLESLSAYKNIYAVHDARAELNPVLFCHYHYTLGGRSISLLSRIAPAVADHTQRSNKLAHHVVITKRERPAGGPAWLAMQDGFFLQHWDRDPQRIPTPKAIPEGDEESTFAAAWESMGFDPGWAGVLAHAFLARPTVPAYLVFEPGMETLPLLKDALALVGADKRWDVTFNTHFSSLPAGTTCCWRCCVPDTGALREARRNPRTLVIDLSNPTAPPTENALVTCAREGTPVPATPRRPTEGAQRFRPLANRNRSALRMGPVKRKDFRR